VNLENDESAESLMAENRRARIRAAGWFEQMSISSSRHKDRVEIRGMGGAAGIRIGGWVGWLRADG